MSLSSTNTAVIEFGPLKITFPIDLSGAESADPSVDLGGVLRGSGQRGLDTPPVGEYWEGQGGIYAGVMPGLDGNRPYHLIASVDEATHVSWGGYGHDEVGARSQHNGFDNQLDLIESKHHHPAAEWAEAYTKDGRSDFYLPAQRELSLCWATIAEKFEKAWYWSSTQYSAAYAWGQGFDSGNQSSTHKDDLSCRARAVRRLFI